MVRAPLVAALVASFAFAGETIEEDLSDVKEAERPELFFGVNIGGGYSVITHPQLNGTFFAPTLSLVAGVFVNPKLSVGLEFQSTAKWVHRQGDGMAGNVDPFTAGVNCTKCMPHESSGELSAITATFSSLGPRADFAPWGRNGLFLGAALGVAFIQGLPSTSSVGFAGSGHAGVRYRFLQVAELAVEVGLYGQRYADASLLTPYSAASARLHF